MTAAWGYRDTFPRACNFCGHVQNGEGICQCPPTCATCGAGLLPPELMSCCGTINVMILPRVTIGL